MKNTPEDLRHTNVYITKRQHVLFTQTATRLNIKVSELIRRALDYYIDNVGLDLPMPMRAAYWIPPELEPVMHLAYNLNSEFTADFDEAENNVELQGLIIRRLYKLRSEIDSWKTSETDTAPHRAINRASYLGI